MKLKIALPVLLASLVLVACGEVDPNSPLGQRQTIFKQMLKTSEDLGGMLRGRLAFDEQRFTEGAAELDRLAHAPWQHFPQVREEDGSQAKDEVWQRQARFQQLARELEAPPPRWLPPPPLSRCASANWRRPCSASRTAARPVIRSFARSERAGDCALVPLSN